ncbi:segregation and condensation protein A [Ktedonospora formicarum]|uniref:Segregation and condensation protein A n=1 Tax=Ktedonospora formicarum TaxID=2778364 RepID=A0A8J3HZP7_9CHLR|nr:segregation/condensation protein A [Ktedonospora formicarum]GHO44085.1 segregation/condensation protein A [Ktedonospora formicarum]
MLEQVSAWQEAEPQAINEQSTHEQRRYVIHLPSFEGPLDLLLHLIEKRQLEITTVSLLAVTDQYLDYLSECEAEALPLANMAAFVSIAARLLYIKSQSLLPQMPRTEEHDSNESAASLAEELQQHLVEYKLTKEIAQALKQREDEGLQTHGRSGLLAGIEAQLAWTPPTLMGLEVQSLARALQRLLDMKGREEANGDQLMPVSRVRVSDRIAEIVERLQEREMILFEEVVANEQSRFVIVVTFIAALELWKWQRINIAQDALFSSIMLTRGDRWDAVEQDEVED